jgi:hypothetical protein
MRFLDKYWWALAILFVIMIATWHKSRRGPPA